jgi:hypothetical protein
MRNLLSTGVIFALTALATQGCIVYDHDRDDCDDGWCGDGDWDDGDWCDEDDDFCEEDGRDDRTDDGSDTDDGTVDDEPAPSFELYLEPGQAELGETFLARLTAEGDFDVATVSDVRFTGGAVVRWSESREGELVFVVDVPMSADLGPADLVVARGEAPAVLFEGALFIGEPGSGNSADDCE